METVNVLSLILGILGCVFGLLGLVGSIVALVYVIGWKNSTHQIQWVNPGQTREEIDAPSEILDQLPSSPEPKSLQQWVREQQMQDSGLLYEQDTD